MAFEHTHVGYFSADRITQLDIDPYLLRARMTLRSDRRGYLDPETEEWIDEEGIEDVGISAAWPDHDPLQAHADLSRLQEWHNSHGGLIRLQVHLLQDGSIRFHNYTHKQVIVIRPDAPPEVYRTPLMLRILTWLCMLLFIGIGIAMMAAPWLGPEVVLITNHVAPLVTMLAILPFGGIVLFVVGMLMSQEWREFNDGRRGRESVEHLWRSLGL